MGVRMELVLTKDYATHIEKFSDHQYDALCICLYSNANYVTYGKRLVNLEIRLPASNQNVPSKLSSYGIAFNNLAIKLQNGVTANDFAKPYANDKNIVCKTNESKHQSQ